MPISDLYNYLDVEETGSGADWDISGGGLPTGEGGETDWLAFMQQFTTDADESNLIPGLSGQDDVSGYEGTQTNPWEASFYQVPFDPTTATGEEIATWIAMQGFGGSGQSSSDIQDDVNWFVNEYSSTFENYTWGDADDPLGFYAEMMAAQQGYAQQESQMWADYGLWQGQSMSELEQSLSDLSLGYTEGLENIQQNKRDQLASLIAERRSAESASVASLTDLRRQAGRSGFGARGLESAMSGVQGSLQGYTSSASQIQEMTDQALADMDIDFSLQTEAAYTAYTDEAEMEWLTMQGDLELWQAQWEADVENTYYDWAAGITDELADILEEGFGTGEGVPDIDDFNIESEWGQLGQEGASGMVCPPGETFNWDTGECEVPAEDDPTEGYITCPDGSLAPTYGDCPIIDDDDTPWDDEGECDAPPSGCGPFSVWDAALCQCVYVGGGGGGGGGGRPTYPADTAESIRCGTGYILGPNGECVWTGTDA